MGFFNFLKWRAGGKQADQARGADSSASSDSEPIRINKSLVSESAKDAKNADLADSSTSSDESIGPIVLNDSNHLTQIDTSIVELKRLLDAHDRYVRENVAKELTIQQLIGFQPGSLNVGLDLVEPAQLALFQNAIHEPILAARKGLEKLLEAAAEAEELQLRVPVSEVRRELFSAEQLVLFRQVLCLTPGKKERVRAVILGGALVPRRVPVRLDPRSLSEN